MPSARTSIPAVFFFVLLAILPRSASSGDVADTWRRMQNSALRRDDDYDARNKAVRIDRVTPVGEGDPAKIASLRERGEKERQEQIKDLTKQMNMNRKVSAGAKLAVSVKNLKAAKGKYLPCLGEPAAGGIGVLQYPDQDLLPIKVAQVVGKSEAIVEIGDKRAWLKGFSIKDIVDGQFVLIDSPVEVTGTKTYATAAGGTKTMLVIEPFDLPAK